MATTKAPASSGGVWVPTGGFPKEFCEGWFDGTNYQFYTPADYTSRPVSSPRSTITEIFNGSATVTESFFGTHYNLIASLTSVPMRAKIVRIHDTVWNGQRCHWRGTNTANGVFDWTALDQIINYWYNLGYEVLYVLGVTPSWASARPAEAGAYGTGTAAEPSNMTYWTDWCSAVATRYLGKIKYYEIWNETNLTSFYSGTKTILAQLTRLANQTIKAIDSTVSILSPNVTNVSSSGATYFDGFLTASDGATGTGKDWIDVVAVHLYSTASTSLGSTTKTNIDAITSVMSNRGISSKQLWNTETGLLSPDANALSSDKMKHILRSLGIAAALGVKHWSFYMYDHTTMGINDDPRHAEAWNNFRDFLLSGAITQVNSLWDGRVVITVNGNTQVI